MRGMPGPFTPLPAFHRKGREWNHNPPHIGEGYTNQIQSTCLPSEVSGSAMRESGISRTPGEPDNPGLSVMLGKDDQNDLIHTPVEMLVSASLQVRPYCRGLGPS